MPDDMDIRPVPDPTVLTTEASTRLEAALRVMILAEIAHIAALFDEKLLRVMLRFDMLDARTAEQKQDTSNALGAALSAQKEAAATQTESLERSNTKSETATIERIKGVEALLATSTKAMDDKITDLKDRVIAMEARTSGASSAREHLREAGSDTRAIVTSVIGVILLLIAIASVLVAVLKP